MVNKFAEVEHKYRELLKSYQQGSLEAEQFAQALAALAMQDDQQKWWQIQGNGQWLRYNGEEWKEASPPLPQTQPPPPPRSALMPPPRHDQPVPQIPPPTPTHLAAQSIKCSGCHMPLEPGAKFCGKCGHAVAPPGCPKCQAPFLAGAHFCKSCGQKLS